MSKRRSSLLWSRMAHLLRPPNHRIAIPECVSAWGPDPAAHQCFGLGLGCRRREPGHDCLHSQPQDAGAVQRAPPVTGLQADIKLARIPASGKTFWPAEAEKPCIALSSQMPSRCHRCLAVDHVCGPPRGFERLRALSDLVCGSFSECGWGTWIRTKILGVRVRCSTVELSPN